MRDARQLELPFEDLLTTAEVAALLRVPAATLRYWRHLGTGPASFKVGRHVRYFRGEVVEWVRELSTSNSGIHSR